MEAGFFWLRRPQGSVRTACASVSTECLLIQLSDADLPVHSVTTHCLPQLARCRFVTAGSWHGEADRRNSNSTGICGSHLSALVETDTCSPDLLGFCPGLTELHLHIRAADWVCSKSVPISKLLMWVPHALWGISLCTHTHHGCWQVKVLEIRLSVEKLGR